MIEYYLIIPTGVIIATWGIVKFIRSYIKQTKPRELKNMEKYFIAHNVQQEISSNNIANDYPTYCKYCSNGIEGLGVKNVLKYLQALDNYGKSINENNVIVSVGSGIGFIEFLAEKLFKIKFICVDPHPSNFYKGHSIALNDITIFRKPDYNYVDDLIKERPDIIGNCSLFLNWTWPEENYDMDAFDKLNPHSMTSIYGPNRAAGGPIFVDKFDMDDDVRYNVRIYVKFPTLYSCSYWKNSDELEIENANTIKMILWIKDKEAVIQDPISLSEKQEIYKNNLRLIEHYKSFMRYYCEETNRQYIDGDDEYIMGQQ